MRPEEDHPAARRKLGHQHIQPLLGRAVDDDHVKRPLGGATLGQSPEDGLGVCEAERLEIIPSGLRQRLVRLERNDRGCQSGENGGRVTGRAGDIEDAIARLDVGRLDQAGENERHQHGARALAARESVAEFGIGVGDRFVSRRHEFFARNVEEAAEDSLIGHAERTNLALDRRTAQSREIFDGTDGSLTLHRSLPWGGWRPCGRPKMSAPLYGLAPGLSTQTPPWPYDGHRRRLPGDDSSR